MDDFLDVDLKKDDMRRVIKDSLRELLKEKYVFEADPKKETIEIDGVGNYLNFTYLLRDSMKEGVKEYLTEIGWKKEKS
ncbi:MAG: hypothetical protein ABH950_01320 [Candidatus Altiarchaeota archaeon]